MVSYGRYRPSSSTPAAPVGAKVAATTNTPPAPVVGVKEIMISCEMQSIFFFSSNGCAGMLRRRRWSARLACARTTANHAENQVQRPKGQVPTATGPTCGCPVPAPNFPGPRARRPGLAPVTATPRLDLPSHVRPLCLSPLLDRLGLSASTRPSRFPRPPSTTACSPRHTCWPCLATPLAPGHH